MWYIVWNIDSRVKQDILSFDNHSSALKYAAYYKSLLEVYNAGNHMQKRFAESTKDPRKSRISVSFQIMQK